jgi:hypothetical protein
VGAAAGAFSVPLEDHEKEPPPDVKLVPAVLAAKHGFKE